MLQDPKSGVLSPVGIGHRILPCRNENSYRVPWHVFFKYNSPYHIEMGTYVLIDLCWAGGSVAPAQPTSLRWNRGIFAQTYSICLEGPYNIDSSGAHPWRAIDRAWEPRIPSRCSLKAITHATGSKIGSSRSRWIRGTEYYPVGMKTHIEYPDIFFLKI